jgi:uncharacterized membrane protein
MAHVEKSVTIHAPVQKVFDYIIDPHHSSEWIRSMESTGDISGSKKGDRFKWTYKMAGISFNGSSEIVDQAPNKEHVVHSTGGIDATWYFNFKDLGGDTDLKLAIDYTVPVPVLGKVAEKLILKQNEKEAEESLATLREKLEG